MEQQHRAVHAREQRFVSECDGRIERGVHVAARFVTPADRLQRVRAREPDARRQGSVVRTRRCRDPRVEPLDRAIVTTAGGVHQAQPPLHHRHRTPVAASLGVVLEPEPE